MSNQDEEDDIIDASELTDNSEPIENTEA